MKVFKSNRLFCNFYPTLPKTFFKLKMTKRNVENGNCKSQIYSGVFVKIRDVHTEGEWGSLDICHVFVDSIVFKQ